MRLEMRMESNVSKNNQAIPVVMYHSVGRALPDWKWSYLTVPFHIFEDHLRWLVKKGYQTVGLDQLYLHASGHKPLSPKSVVLTFDDGYVDNWTYVVPLLKKYGCTGTVFVNPDFVDPADSVRANLDDVWAGRILEQDLTVRGFMSWAELRHLVLHGPLKVEAHAMTHTWYPSGPRIIDFHHPDDDHYWLDWNHSPEQKPYYLLAPRESRVPWGTPVYEHQKSLAGRRYFSNPEEARLLAEYVRMEGGISFFSRADWRDQLHDKIASARAGKLQGTYETDQDQVLRYRYELTECKRILEEQLGRNPCFLCWPGGGYNEVSRTMALELYTSVTLGSADPSPNRNRPGDNPQLIRRIGVPGFWLKGRYVYPGGRYFIQVLKEYQGSKIARRYRQMQKACIVACSCKA